MFSCEFCGGEFKNRSGLSGHKRMAHHSESTSETTTQVVQDYSKSTGPTTKEVVRQHLEDYLGERLERQDELLAGVLQRLDEVLPKQSDHGHGQHRHDPATCDGCRDFLQEFQDNPDDDDHPVEHEHGDNCPQCVHEQLKGVQRSAVWHDKNVPGSKEAREHAMIGEQMVTIVP